MLLKDTLEVILIYFSALSELQQLAQIQPDIVLSPFNTNFLFIWLHIFTYNLSAPLYILTYVQF
jgi:hypothetical protein